MLAGASTGTETTGVRSRLPIACFGAWMVLLTVAFYAVPSLHVLVWPAIGLSSIAAVVVGVLVHRPRRVLPWLVVAGALLTFTVCETTYHVLTDLLHRT